MSSIAYAASKKDFIYDFDTNVFMTKLCEGAALNRIGRSYSEKKSWKVFPTVQLKKSTNICRSVITAAKQP